ncbi:LLM class flavin-dependent oxidoreductase [Acaricomes phytoseiuli]|uniref:LLM class flavin-dependent oxidoreductase n=1 Tax=Acaricomes phytoseiuli TaxID=291968 RepID=UPI002223CF12|nr:LLM class flavin-dependent oxidoreductase [Acaricomes phytoseiuli]MCW1250674.1 LLM class flavin-dependent oxidoreductase [Acaricomes phytoseiuli]
MHTTPPDNETVVDNVREIEFGLNTFGDITEDAQGQRVSQAQVIRDVVTQGQLADEVGLDFFGVGEHHRDDFSIAAPETVLAALASTTEQIQLGSAVTVLSSDDPVRVFERFATLDALSSGRAEVVLGRGSFVESFPLFGYRLEDYDKLFTEKFELFHRLLDEGPVNWSGETRAPLQNMEVFPKTESGRLKAWLGVGGSPESVLRSVQYQIPMMLAVIGGAPERFVPYVDLYRRAQAESGVAPSMPLALHSPGFVAPTDEEAKEVMWPHHQKMRDRIGAERGWGPISTIEYEREIQGGSLYVGSPETVARKIARTIKLLGVNRFDLKYSAGTLGHDQLMRNIKLYGTEVVPRVREILAGELDEKSE